MRKQVYLFELDSVRDSREEIERAQKALFEEIVLNGNSVVLSFNQLSDSRGFLRALADGETSRQIIHMFELGHLKVAQYRNERGDLVRTASQYFQEALSKNAKYARDNHNAFHFSTFDGLGLSEEDFRDIQQAVAFCDVPLLSGKLYAKEALEAPQISPEGRQHREHHNYIWNYIINVVTLIIAMSQSSFAMVEPALSHSTLYEAVKHFIEDRGKLVAAIEVLSNANFDKQKLLTLLSDGKVHHLLAQIDANLSVEDNKQSRSLWKERIRSFLQDSPDTCHVADLVIDLLYNYVVEDGIQDVCKHYQGSIGSDSFWKDFAARLTLYWNDSQSDREPSHKIHYYYKENRPFSGASPEEAEAWLLNRIELAPWDTADHIVEKIRSISSSEETYEQVYLTSRKAQKKYLRIRFLRIFGSVCASIVLFVIINTVLGWVQGLAEIDSNGIFLLSILFALISTIVFSILGSFISNKIHLTDLLDSFGQFCTTVKDVIITRKHPRDISYHRDLEDDKNVK